MRRVVIVVMLTIAGLIPLLRYHPSSTTTAAPAAAAAPASPASPAAGSSGGTVINGSTVDTEFGPYQVQVTFEGTKITDVKIIDEPGDRRSQRIASSAEPTLKEEALQAQSAKIDTVSGATITSEAYAQSLQAAIDAKG
ncbi:FMN-binding protein [Amycolatopsis acidicola]|uniref:FMN-binding protein n=1 Tax=Amycolatopsis acidicola TaxID=2596893 RepID=A0A5N0UY09_9PSEU|nr:FMN-binding protein [Amycolatopsis acidicola]KAA9158095.1 FMN-binding protein [Amycolatopsis acidicola]